MSEAGKQVFEWVHEEKPEEMCVTVGFCPAASSFTYLPSALTDLAKKTFSVQDDDQCNTCQLVILEASSVLSDPVSHSESRKTILSCQNVTLIMLCM